MRDMNKAFSENTGAKVNREVCYGLNVPCVRLYRPNIYVYKWMKELVEFYSLMDIIICAMVTLFSDKWTLAFLN